jgi:hypothetical protein
VRLRPHLLRIRVGAGGYERGRIAGDRCAFLIGIGIGKQSSATDRGDRGSGLHRASKIRRCALRLLRLAAATAGAGEAKIDARASQDPCSRHSVRRLKRRSERKGGREVDDRRQKGGGEWVKWMVGSTEK